MPSPRPIIDARVWIRIEIVKNRARKAATPSESAIESTPRPPGAQRRAPRRTRREGGSASAAGRGARPSGHPRRSPRADRRSAAPLPSSRARRSDRSRRELAVRASPSSCAAPAAALRRGRPPDRARRRSEIRPSRPEDRVARVEGGQGSRDSRHFRTPARSLRAPGAAGGGRERACPTTRSTRSGEGRPKRLWSSSRTAGPGPTASARRPRGDSLCFGRPAR